MLYPLLRNRKPVRIVELGVGTARRTERIIQVTQRYTSEQIHYTGIDLFESRPKPQLALKDAHRLLKPLGTRLRLLPGEPHQALAGAANSLSQTDLLLISADQDEASLQAAWFYVPRMLHPGSLVLHEQPVAAAKGPSRFVEISSLDIERLATASSKRRAA